MFENPCHKNKTMTKTVIRCHKKALVKAENLYGEIEGYSPTHMTLHYYQVV